MSQNNASYDLRDYLINDAGVSLTIFVSKGQFDLVRF